MPLKWANSREVDNIGNYANFNFKFKMALKLSEVFGRGRIVIFLLEGLFDSGCSSVL